MRSKKEISVLVAEMQIILNILNERKDGMLSLEIAAIAGFSSKKTRQLLVALRSRNIVNCEIVDESKNIRLWTTQKVAKARNGSQIYPDLDAQHEEWRKQVLCKKLVYNPWGKQ